MYYEIEYVQSPRERYDSNMNDRVRDAIGIGDGELREEWGGSALVEDLDALCADAGFNFSVSNESDANVIHLLVREIVGPDRITRFEEVDR